jgi:hypothetical protein
MVKVVNSNKLNEAVNSKRDLNLWNFADVIVPEDGGNQFDDFKSGVNLCQKAIKEKKNIFYGYANGFGGVYVIAKNETDALDIISKWQ